MNRLTASDWLLFAGILAALPVLFTARRLRGLVVALVLLTTPAYAVDRDNLRAIVTVGRTDPGGGGSFCGVGTIVASDGRECVILTCAHVFDTPGSGDWVSYHDGRRVRAVLKAADQHFDLATLIAPNPPASAKVIPVARAGEHPLAGDLVEFIGHGGGHLRHMDVKVNGYAERDSGSSLWNQLSVAFRPISGDSGGPFLFKGKVVGVNWGGPGDAHGATVAHGSWAGRIGEFLTQCYGGNCPGGNCFGGGGADIPWTNLPAPANPQPAAMPQPAAADNRLNVLIGHHNDAMKALAALQKQVAELAKRPAAEACKCGPPGKACACDLDGIEARLNVRLDALEAKLALKPVEQPANQPDEQPPRPAAGPAFYEIRPRKH